MQYLDESPTPSEFDPVTLEILWSRLISIADESAAARTARAKKILKNLRKVYSDADCALRHKSALELLVSTILSAQCTDDRVNKVTPALFKRFKSAKAFASADPAELEELVKSTGFYRNKTKNIIGAGRVICEK